MTARCRVAILTFNSESIIGETLAQAQKIDPRPFVVDSFSTDRTPHLLRAANCELVQREFKSYGEQRGWAIGQLNPRADWQLHLDADEVLDDTAVAAICAVLHGGARAPYSAYLLRRRDYFLGRQLRHSGLNPWHLRLFRAGQGACENRLYDQHFVSPGPAGRLAGCMHDKNALRLSDWTARHNRWSDLEAAEILGDDGGGGGDDGGAAETTGRLRGRLFGDPRERTRWLKQRYYRLPGGLRATAYFFYRYVLRLGFLDGREGLYFAFLQALWFRLLVDAKVFEARKSGRQPPS